MNWFERRFPVYNTAKQYLKNYKLPNNLNGLYVFGFLAMIILVNQFLTGLWLTMFYTPTTTNAFNSIQTLIRDVHSGWLLHDLHSTGASFYFIILYIHIFRSLLYGSYKNPRELVWLLGVGLFFLSLGEAFFGYLLPWGQLSFWGAQVITSLLGAIPWVGDTAVIWLRGDYTVGDSTLHRFFALHIIAIPFLLLFFVMLHVVALHQVGSNNPQGIDQNVDEKIPFHPYYTIKDKLALLIFLTIFLAIVFFQPDMNGIFLERDNWVPANELVTPQHITPMWYMSPFYAMLRAIPNKAWGIVTILSAFNLLFFLPWLDRSPVRSMRFKGKLSKTMFILFIISFVGLGYLGRQDITAVKQWFSQFFLIVYFAYFLLMPIYTRFERCQSPQQQSDKC